MMSKIPVGTTDDRLQLNKGQKTGQEDTEVSVKHYPLIAKRMAGPLMILQPDSFLDQVTCSIKCGAKILVLESAGA